MGRLINGHWHDQWYDTESTRGAFERESAQLRNWVTPDGLPGPSGRGGFAAESGRYHLYVSLACPWAHRTLIFRKIKGLEPHIGVSVVSPDMLEQGWHFDTNAGSTGEPLFSYQYLHQLYTRNKDDYSGRVTVPLLWDKKQECIVSNESSEIIRMFNSAFDALTGDRQDFYPSDLRPLIDTINEDVYHYINNGVYRCGFATTQAAYSEAFYLLFDALDRMEALLSRQNWLAGDRVTEADWRLFTTLLRFDLVYHGHFKCNRQRLEDFTNLSHYVRALYQWPGVKDTVDFDQIKRHYYFSHGMINPTRVVPLGPDVDYDRPHNRLCPATSASGTIT
jgi:putative glutathione S-transferase